MNNVTTRDSMLATLLLILGVTAVFESSGSIQIINGPRNTTGILGSTVTFPCEVEGTTDLPQWRINGTNYGVTSLPFWHWFTRRDGLSVYLASVEMNNTLYACLYYTYAPETGEELIILSEEALLTVYINTYEQYSSIVTKSRGACDTSTLFSVYAATANSYVTSANDGHGSQSDFKPTTSQITSSVVTVTVRSSVSEYNQVQGPSVRKSSETVHFIGIGCGVVVIFSTLGLVIGLGLLLWQRRLKTKQQKGTLEEPVYDTICETSRVSNVTGTSPVYEMLDAPDHSKEQATKEDEIPMKQNSAYVVPPPRLKIKVKKNEAYSSCSVQH